mgnify:CR=1 FL=1|jgi:glycine betaine/choline ABC-type transport system substrate-binding protein
MEYVTRVKKSWKKPLINGVAIIFVLIYWVLVFFLLHQELTATSNRATETVVMLLALIFLPVLLLFVAPLIGSISNLSLKLGSAEIRFQKLEQQVKETQNKTRQLSEEMEGTLSSAERTLYPLIGGMHENASKRLQKKPPTLVIGSKDFAANIVIAETLAYYLEKRLPAVKIQRWIPNGGTITNYACIINGWIDLFVDYTGTGCLMFGIEHRDPDTLKRRKEESILDDLRIRSSDHDFNWMEPIGTETDYCLVMLDKDDNKIKTISDLAKMQRGKLSFCGNYEFLNRRDGLPGIKQEYKLRFRSEKVCSYRERYQLVADGFADVSVGHTTDPEIKDLGLRQLVDDRNFFPCYQEVPLVRTMALNHVDGLENALKEFHKQGIDNDDLRSLISDYRQGHPIERSIKELLK